MLLNLYSILVVGFVPIFCWHDFHILLCQQLSISWLQSQLFVVVVVVKNPHIVVVKNLLCVFWSISQLSFTKLPMLDWPMVVTPVKNGHKQNRNRWKQVPFDLFVLWSTLVMVRRNLGRQRLKKTKYLFCHFFVVLFVIFFVISVLSVIFFVIFLSFFLSFQFCLSFFLSFFCRFFVVFLLISVLSVIFLSFFEEFFDLFHYFWETCTKTTKKWQISTKWQKNDKKTTNKMALLQLAKIAFFSKHCHFFVIFLSFFEEFFDLFHYFWETCTKTTKKWQIFHKMTKKWPKNDKQNCAFAKIAFFSKHCHLFVIFLSFLCHFSNFFSLF